jgi:PhzF family phenazine biosynthesis protein
MRTPIFQIDASTNRRFAGNPAAVMPMDNFLPDAALQAIAAENNLSETAFLVREGEDYRLRWFTPNVEVPLCGHATLASAAVVMERLEPQNGDIPHRERRTDGKPGGCGLRHEFPGTAVRPGFSAGGIG